MRRVAGAAGQLAAWLGGWSRLLLLALVVAAVGGGLLWERWRQPPVPQGASQVNTALNVDIRQTSFRYPGTAEELRAFYQQSLPPRGWRYCGTQDTPGCSNMPRLAGGAGQPTEVYRRSDDGSGRGPTLEIRPLPSEDGVLFVTLYETSGG